MNLQESNKFVEQMEKNNKNKRMIIAALVALAVIIILLMMTINYIRAKEAQKLKMFVNGKQVTITSTLLLQDENGNNYMNVRELASLLGYSYQKGEYKNYTEDSDSCYLETPFEIISMSAASDMITKYLINDGSEDTSTDLIVTNETTGQQEVNIVVDSEDETMEIFSIDDKIEFVNNELYVPFTELPRIFSSQLNATQNRINIYSIPALAVSAANMASNRGYSGISNLYENLTAIIDNMLIVTDGVNYGVISLDDGHEIISLKYDKILYRQNTMEFFVTAENSVGIIDSEGKTIVKPTAYDSITSFDELYKLYLVKKDKKYGIVNRDGKTVVYAEYDSIGLENAEEFEDEDIRNFNLLFDECIPVVNNGKVGLIDIEGNEKLRCVYDSLGYSKNFVKTSSEENNNSNTTNTTNTTTTTTTSIGDFDNVLTIPESVGIKGIVVNLNGLYGLYDAEAGRLIIPCACSKIYSKTRAGNTKYYLEFNNQEIDLIEYLEQNDLISVKQNEEINEVEDAENNIVENEEIEE